MEYVELGKTGLKVSRLCFGALVIGPLQKNMPVEDGAAVIRAALERGVTFIDTAELYGTYGHIREALICLEKLGIGHLAYANYQTLSAGLKQMAIIARALLQNGKYMIFDEPDCNLDYINKNRLMKRIREITKVYRKGSLISMHDPALALNFCDRILLVRDGSITEIDLQKEPLGSIEEKLSIVYGNIKIQRCEGKYVVFLCD